MLRTARAVSNSNAFAASPRTRANGDAVSTCRCAVSNRYANATRCVWLVIRTYDDAVARTMRRADDHHLVRLGF